MDNLTDFKYKALIDMIADNLRLGYCDSMHMRLVNDGQAIVSMLKVIEPERYKERHTELLNSPEQKEYECRLVNICKAGSV